MPPKSVSSKSSSGAWPSRTKKGRRVRARLGEDPVPTATRNPGRRLDAQALASQEGDAIAWGKLAGLLSSQSQRHTPQAGRCGSKEQRGEQTVDPRGVSAQEEPGHLTPLNAARTSSFIVKPYCYHKPELSGFRHSTSRRNGPRSASRPPASGRVGRGPALQESTSRGRAAEGSPSHRRSGTSSVSSPGRQVE